MARQISFLRWAGGKTWFIPHFHELVRGLQFNRYFEPFLGGASIYFSLDGNHKAYLSDINDDLINAYIALRDSPNRVISLLKEYSNDEKMYYEIRESKPKSTVQRAARFIYLNFNSYNGLYRVNNMGEYNVPYGFRVASMDFQKLVQFSNKLKECDLRSGDFEITKNEIRARDLIFLDPPYTVSHIPAENGFIKYNAKLFSLDSQERLGCYIDHIKRCDAYYILTNDAHDKIKQIFDKGDRLIPLTRSCMIGGTNAVRGDVNEYLFTNIPEGRGL
jgi:DNA adenine methylase